MNDPTAAERDALASRLTAAIPAEPELTDLAGRAEHGARRVRRVRRAGIASVAALAVAAVVALPQILGSRPTHEGAPPGAMEVPAHPCGGKPDHRDFTQGTPAWVTFCPSTPTGTSRMELHPSGVLRMGAAALVAGWRSHIEDFELAPMCGTETGQTYVRVGFADGTVSEIDVVCVGLISGGHLGVAESGSQMYVDLVSALGRQAASGYPRYTRWRGPPRRCPTSFSTPGHLNSDGASARELSHSRMILDMTAVAGLVCRYDGSGALTASGPAADPEGLRVTTGVGVWDRAFEDWRSVPATSYLVSLRDRTNTWRTFTITGRKHVVTFYRGTSPAVPEQMGYAADSLVRLARQSTR